MNILPPDSQVSTPTRPNFPALDLGLVYSETSVPSTTEPAYSQEDSPFASESGWIELETNKTRSRYLRRSVLTASRLHCQQRSKWRVAMLTPTYAPENDWAPFQISALIRHIRKYLLRKNVEMRFVWVQEFTKKGRPHYHLLIWLPLGLTLPKPDKRGWWPYGMTKVEWARNAVGYIAKYASKADSLHKPARGARMHGNGGLTGDALLEQRWWKLPAWAREQVSPQDRARRMKKGGGILLPETGEILETPWVIMFIKGRVYARRTSVSFSECCKVQPPDFDALTDIERFYLCRDGKPFSTVSFDREGDEPVFPI